MFEENTFPSSSRLSLIQSEGLLPVTKLVIPNDPIPVSPFASDIRLIVVRTSEYKCMLGAKLMLTKALSTLHNGPSG